MHMGEVSRRERLIAAGAHDPTRASISLRNSIQDGIFFRMAYFFYSYVGMYVAQSFFHGAIAALIVDRSIQAWRITNPATEQRFRLISILVPVFSFPAYQAINPDRGSIPFRLDSLFDISSWLYLEIWGKIPLGLFFVLILLVTTAIFLLQEMIPVVRHMIETRQPALSGENRAGDPSVDEALEGLPGDKPDVFILEDDEPHLFSATGSKPAIFLTSALVRVLNLEQMQAAIAHEMAHIKRSRRPLLVVVFLLRVFMFFNPAVLLEFRRLVQGEEMICDDMAVSVTRKPHVLAETLKHFYHPIEDNYLRQRNTPLHLRNKIEEHSHNLLIDHRVARLERGAVPATDGAWLPMMVTLLAILVINYYIV